MKDGKQQLDSFFKDYVDDMKESYNSVTNELGSPIEELLLAALLGESFCQCQMVYLQGHDDGVCFGNL